MGGVLTALRPAQFQRLSVRNCINRSVEFSKPVSFGKCRFQFVMLLERETLLVYFRPRKRLKRAATFILEIGDPENLVVTLKFHASPVNEIALPGRKSLNALQVRIISLESNESSPSPGAAMCSIRSLVDVQALPNGQTDIYDRRFYENGNDTSDNWYRKDGTFWFFMLPGVSELFGPLGRDVALKDLRVLNYTVPLLECPEKYPLFFVELGPPAMFFGAVTRATLENVISREYVDIRFRYDVYDGKKTYPIGSVFTGRHNSQTVVSLCVDDRSFEFGYEESFSSVLRECGASDLFCDGIVLRETEFPTAQALAELQLAGRVISSR